MARLGPFEQAPHLAVAVSGGADSMALALLAARWAQAEGGRITALTVDHGLRPEAADEARMVGQWCDALRIPHVILTWSGPKPAAGIQSAARAARYDLLAGWCRANRVLHLLTAHHLEDQAETVLLRLGRESGMEGLAAMPPIAESPHFRLLRPLLDTPKAALLATLKAHGQPWLDDPSNLDPAHTRTRLRAFTRRLAAAGVSSRDLAGEAVQHAKARAAADEAMAGFLASVATIHHEGWCTLDPAPLAEADADLRRRALARVLVTVGGRRYPPRGARLERLAADLARGTLAAARTLGGCRILPWRQRLLVCREPAAARQRISVTGPGELRWDNRFTLHVAGMRASAGTPLTIARLGRAGWAAVAAQDPTLRDSEIPAAVRPSLPALWSGDTVLSVPHLNHRCTTAEGADLRLESPIFAPISPLAKARFSVAK